MADPKPRNPFPEVRQPPSATSALRMLYPPVLPPSRIKPNEPPQGTGVHHVYTGLKPDIHVGMGWRDILERPSDPGAFAPAEKRSAAKLQSESEQLRTWMGRGIDPFELTSPRARTTPTGQSATPDSATSYVQVIAQKIAYSQAARELYLDAATAPPLASGDIDFSPGTPAAKLRDALPSLKTWDGKPLLPKGIMKLSEPRDAQTERAEWLARSLINNPSVQRLAESFTGTGPLAQQQKSLRTKVDDLWSLMDQAPGSMKIPAAAIAKQKPRLEIGEDTPQAKTTLQNEADALSSIVLDKLRMRKPANQEELAWQRHAITEAAAISDSASEQYETAVQIAKMAAGATVDASGKILLNVSPSDLRAFGAPPGPLEFSARPQKPFSYRALEPDVLSRGGGNVPGSSEMTNLPAGEVLARQGEGQISPGRRDRQGVSVPRSANVADPITVHPAADAMVGPLKDEILYGDAESAAKVWRSLQYELSLPRIPPDTPAAESAQIMLRSVMAEPEIFDSIGRDGFLSLMNMNGETDPQRGFTVFHELMPLIAKGDVRTSQVQEGLLGKAAELSERDLATLGLFVREHPDQVPAWLIEGTPPSSKDIIAPVNSVATELATQTAIAQSSAELAKVKAAANMLFASAYDQATRQVEGQYGEYQDKMWMGAMDAGDKAAADLTSGNVWQIHEALAEHSHYYRPDIGRRPPLNLDAQENYKSPSWAKEVDDKIASNDPMIRDWLNEHFVKFGINSVKAGEERPTTSADVIEAIDRELIAEPLPWELREQHEIAKTMMAQLYRRLRSENPDNIRSTLEKMDELGWKVPIDIRERASAESEPIKPQQHGPMSRSERDALRRALKEEMESFSTSQP